MDDRFWFFHCHEDDQQANNGHNQRLCQHLFNANVLSYRACDCWSNGSTNHFSCPYPYASRRTHQMRRCCEMRQGSDGDGNHARIHERN